MYIYYSRISYTQMHITSKSFGGTSILVPPSLQMLSNPVPLPPGIDARPHGDDGDNWSYKTWKESCNQIVATNLQNCKTRKHSDESRFLRATTQPTTRWSRGVEGAAGRSPQKPLNLTWSLYMNSMGPSSTIERAQNLNHMFRIHILSTLTI